MNWWWSCAAVGNHLWTWGSWVCSGGRVWSKTVDLPWRCVFGVRVWSKKPLRHFVLYPWLIFRARNHQVGNPNFLCEPYDFDCIYIYIYMATYIIGYMLSRINTFTCEMFSTLYIYYGIEENFSYESIFGCHKIKLAHLVCACIVWCGTSLW